MTPLFSSPSIIQCSWKRVSIEFFLFKNPLSYCTEGMYFFPVALLLVYQFTNSFCSQDPAIVSSDLPNNHWRCIWLMRTLKVIAILEVTHGHTASTWWGLNLNQDVPHSQAHTLSTLHSWSSQLQELYTTPVVNYIDILEQIILFLATAALFMGFLAWTARVHVHTHPFLRFCSLCWFLKTWFRYDPCKQTSMNSCLWRAPVALCISLLYHFPCHIVCDFSSGPTCEFPGVKGLVSGWYI